MHVGQLGCVLGCEVMDASLWIDQVMEYLNVLINCTEAFRGYTADEDELKKYHCGYIVTDAYIIIGYV